MYMKGALTKFSYNQADALTGHDVRRHKFFQFWAQSTSLVGAKKEALVQKKLLFNAYLKETRQRNNHERRP